MRNALLITLALTLPTLSHAQFDNGDSLVKPNPEFTSETKVEILAGVKKILTERAFVPNVDFSKWDELTEKHKESFESASSTRRFTSAVNRALREFGISHVGLRTPESAKRRRASRTAEDFLQFTQDEDKKEEKPQTPPTRPTRENNIKWIDDKTAVVKIYSFSSGYSRGKVEELVEEGNKAEHLIIDLRSNGGGAVTNLSHLLGLFLPDTEAVGTFVNRRTVNSFLNATQKEKYELAEVAEWTTRKFKPRRPRIKRFEGNLAVLINRGSASASEIFAAALQDLDRATLVGSKTRGAVLASTYGRLPGGFEIQYPVSDYVTIKGQRLEGNPVNPDIEVTTSRTPEGKDAAIEAAIQALIAKDGTPKRSSK